MSDERLFPRAIAEAAHRHVKRSNASIRRWAGEEATDRTLEDDLRELVESYDSSG